MYELEKKTGGYNGICLHAFFIEYACGECMC